MDKLPRRLRPEEVNRFRWDWIDNMPDSHPVLGDIKRLNSIPGLPSMVVSWRDGACIVVRGIPDPEYLDQSALEAGYAIARNQLERIYRNECEATP